MRIDVTPLVGFNEIRFGMIRAQVRAMLGDPTHTAHRGKPVGAPYDMYNELGLFCYYKSSGDLL